MSRRTFFINPSSGSDSNDGHSIQKPWKSLNRANTEGFHPGDTISLKKAAIFRGHLSPKGNGTKKLPIRITAYGSGKTPLIIAQKEDALVLCDQHHWNIENISLSTKGGNRLTALLIQGTTRDYNAYDICISRISIARSSGRGIFAHGCRDIHIQDCSAVNNGETGFMTFDSNKVSFTRCKSQGNSTGFSVGQGSPLCSIRHCIAADNREMGFLLYGVGHGNYRGRPMQTPHVVLVNCVAKGNPISIYMREAVTSGIFHDNILVSSGTTPAGKWWRSRSPIASLFLEGLPFPKRGLHGGWPAANRFSNNTIGSKRGGAVIVAQGPSFKINRFFSNRFYQQGANTRPNKHTPMFIIGGYESSISLPHRGEANTIHKYLGGTIPPRKYFSLNELKIDFPQTR